MPIPLFRPSAGRLAAPAQLHVAALLRVPRVSAQRRRAVLALALGAGLAASAANAADDPFETVQKSAAEWVRIRTETSRLETQWAAERGLLESTVQGLEERAARLEEDRELLRAKTTSEREELERIDAKLRQSAEQLSTAQTRGQTLVSQLTALRPHLPPRLSAALELSYRSLAEPNPSVGAQMQLCLTVLTRCEQFNRVVTTGEEALVVEPGGPPRSLETIYWGLSHGYALDRTTHQAWLGSPGDAGWQWQPCSAAPQVAKLIAIQNDKADPDFVSVPTILRHARPVAPAQ